MTKRNPDIGLDDLESEFDYSSDAGKKKHRLEDGMFKKEYPGVLPVPGRTQASRVFDEEHSRLERQKRRLMTLDVYSRHKELINQYFLYYPGATNRLQRDTSRDRNDYDVLRDYHRFLWDDRELSEGAEKSWAVRLAKRYYDKLFKEYCIADLSQYKKNRIAMRWRIENEVRSGKGQFECGNKFCSSKDSLTSWEVNFGYIENGEKKNALVKLRLCPDCSVKLNFYSKKRRAQSDRKSKDPRAVKEKPSNDRLNEPDEVLGQGPSTSQDAVLDSSVHREGDQLEEVEEKDVKVKAEAEKMAQIWKKPQEPLDPEKMTDADLDEFLEDMFM